jgi:hypothetical protein
VSCVGVFLEGVLSRAQLDWSQGRSRLSRRSASMGALCCCPGAMVDFEDYTTSGGAVGNMSSYNCICVRYCLRWFLRVYTRLVDTSERDEANGGGALQGAATSASAAMLSPHNLGAASGGNSASSFANDAQFEASFRPPPRPLPYDADTRLFRREGLSRRDKAGSFHSEVDRSRDGPGEPLNPIVRSRAVDFEGDSSYRPDSPPGGMKVSNSRASFVSLGDEDGCPTCLDGYTEENPKIPTACGHHFHLGCIYEWMERSKSCPVCDQEMVFSESL